jgi:hypothetical protein
MEPPAEADFEASEATYSPPLEEADGFPYCWMNRLKDVLDLIDRACQVSSPVDIVSENITTQAPVQWVPIQRHTQGTTNH